MTATRILLFAIYLLFEIVTTRDFNIYCKTAEQEDGFCVSVQECQTPLISANSSEVLRNKSEEVPRQYICENTDEENPKVCCPNNTISTATERNQNNQSLQQNVEQHPNGNCGYESGSRSRNKEANITDYKWLVLLKYEKDGDPYICGGSLISQNYIVTAAHCIKNKYKLIGVRLGEYDTRTDTDCIRYQIRRNKDNTVECKPPHQDFNISNEDTIVHPDYSPSSWKDDIGLIRLKVEVDISKDVSPICLPPTSQEESSGSRVYTVAGWGASSSGLSSPTLLQGYARKVDETTCQESTGGNLTANDICTSTTYTGRHCITDDGGPLMSYHGKESRFVLSGIATRMPSSCDRDESFVGYTQIKPYIKWVFDQINS